MTIFQGTAIFFLIVFWTPSIYFLVKRMLFVRRSTVVTGLVVDIKPHMRSAEYTFLIEHDGTQDVVTMYPNVRYQTFRMNDSVDIYRNTMDPKRVYHIKDSLFSLPIIILILTGFFALMFWISGSS